MFSNRIALLIAALMIAASVGAVVAKPSVKVSDDVHPSDEPAPAPGFIVCVRVSGFIASTGSAGLVDELLLDVGRTYPPPKDA